MVRIGNSRIDGQGLFAAQDITKGTRIIAYIGEKITRKESARRLEAGNAYIFHLNYRYALDGKTLANTARYINHSCEPNCEVEKTSDTLWIMALRDIKEGEELATITDIPSSITKTIRATVGPRTVVGTSLIGNTGD
jgi:SET domain-containing protein